MIARLSMLLLIPTLGCAAFTGRDVPNPLGDGYVVSRVAEGFRFTESPLWVPDENALLFSDLDFSGPCWLDGRPCGVIYRLDPAGAVEVVRAPSFNSNGLALDRDGTLVVAESTTRRIADVGPDGEVAVVAERFGPTRFNAPNDLVVARDGTVYFTDPDIMTRAGNRRLGFNGVYRVAPGSGEITLVSDDLSEPNGIVLSRDETVLYVSDISDGLVVAFRLDARGEVQESWTVAKHVIGADGMTIDSDGNLYVAAEHGVVVLAPSGRRIATLVIEDPDAHRPVRPTNCTFGGPDGDVLYVTAEQSVYRIEPRNPSPGR